MTINVESRPGGTEGDNLVKTKLATGDMTDIFWYNSGSLLQALNPAQTLVDLTDEPYIANIADSFIPTVSQNGGIFGVPSGTAMGGGILYNKKIYAAIGLSVPKTWAEFEANNEKIKAAGIAPVSATYKARTPGLRSCSCSPTTATSRRPSRTSPTDYTANKVKYADDPCGDGRLPAPAGRLRQGLVPEGLRDRQIRRRPEALADGQGRPVPDADLCAWTIATNHPEAMNDIGFFAQPGTDAAKNGATIWMPAATYIPKTTTGEKLAAAKDFLGVHRLRCRGRAATAAQPPPGPYVIKGAKLPADVLPAVLDIQKYIDSGAGHAGPRVPLAGQGSVAGADHRGRRIRPEVGRGRRDPYDKDVEKQAKQLGLPGW